MPTLLCEDRLAEGVFKIDRALAEEARRLGKHKSLDETINAALAEYVRLRKKPSILACFGTVDFDPGYDYKRERLRKRVPDEGEIWQRLKPRTR
jgi:hypothetical protein